MRAGRGRAARQTRRRRRADHAVARTPGQLLQVLAPLARETLVYNTICEATEQRQEAAREVASEVDVVLVVGGRNSANTRRLAALCREIQPRTYHVERAGEIEPGWFAGAGIGRHHGRRLHPGRGDRRGRRSGAAHCHRLTPGAQGPGGGGGRRAGRRRRRARRRSHHRRSTGSRPRTCSTWNWRPPTVASSLGGAARRPAPRSRAAPPAGRASRHRAARRLGRAAAPLRQRLRVLLRRPASGRAAALAVRQGRRLPPELPHRQLHHPEQSARADLERIERLRLSPLYVSLHAWDDDAPRGPDGEAGRRRAVERLLTLVAAGIRTAHPGRPLPRLERRRGARRDRPRAGRPGGRGGRRRRARVGRRRPPAEPGRRGTQAAATAPPGGGAAAGVPMRGGAARSCTRPTSSTCSPAACLRRAMPPASTRTASASRPPSWTRRAGSAAPPAGRGGRPSRCSAARWPSRWCATPANCSAAHARSWSANSLFGSHVTVTGLLGGAEVLEALGRAAAGGRRVAAGAGRLPAAAISA